MVISVVTCTSFFYTVNRSFRLVTFCCCCFACLLLFFTVNIDGHFGLLLFVVIVVVCLFVLFYTVNRDGHFRTYLFVCFLHSQS